MRVKLQALICGIFSLSIKTTNTLLSTLFSRAYLYRGLCSHSRISVSDTLYPMILNLYFGNGPRREKTDPRASPGRRARLSRLGPTTGSAGVVFLTTRDAVLVVSEVVVIFAALAAFHLSRLASFCSFVLSRFLTMPGRT